MVQLLRLWTALAALALVQLAAGSVISPPESDNFELLILHNNDMHARFEQTSQLSGVCNTADREAGKCYGGFPRVAHVVKEARQAASNGSGPPVLYLNAGDTYTGTAWFTIYKWRIAAECINALQPDAVSFGNDEFEEKTSTLSPFAEHLIPPILAANIILHNEDDTKQQKIHKSVIFNIGTVKVGVIGYLKPNNVPINLSEIKYIDEVIAIQDEVDNLKSNGVNIIIALGHSDDNKDVEIAREVDGLDLVIAGHKNKYSWNLSPIESNDETRPIIVKQANGKGVPIIKSYAYYKYLGNTKVTFNSQGELLTYDSQPVLLDSTIPQDDTAVQLLERYGNEIIRATEQVVGSTAVVLDGESCGSEECNLGNLITDAMIYYHAIRFEGETWTDAPIAIINSGAILSSIAPSNRPAEVTLHDLMQVLPEGDNIVAVTMNGATLVRLLEKSIAEFDPYDSSAKFLQYSGIRVTYEGSEQNGWRIVSAVARCSSCNVPEFFDIDDFRSYKILMPSSLTQILSESLHDSDSDVQPYDGITCLREYIDHRSPVYPDVSGRININNAATGLKLSVIMSVITLISIFKF